MDNFFVIPNKYKDPKFTIANKIQNYLSDNKKSCMIYREKESSDKTYAFTDPTEVPKNTECVITLGGDGTLIQAARDLRHKSLPLLGVNKGTLGYLAEVDENSLTDVLNNLIFDQYWIEKRIMINAQIIRDDKIIYEDIALNDIVLSKKNAGVIRFNVYVDKQFITSYTADGMIVSTPTGSTAYNLSAGGPIVIPSASLFVMMPICPHSLNNRSIVLPSTSIIDLEVDMGVRYRNNKQIVSYDGDVVAQLTKGDVIRIGLSNTVTKLIKISRTSFIEVLRRKIY